MAEKSVGEMYNDGWAIVLIYLNRAGMPPETAKEQDGMLYYYFQK